MSTCAQDKKQHRISREFKSIMWSSCRGDCFQRRCRVLCALMHIRFLGVPAFASGVQHQAGLQQSFSSLVLGVPFCFLCDCRLKGNFLLTNREGNLYGSEASTLSG